MAILRYGTAKAVARLSEWGLSRVLHRPAANFPGKIALYIDPEVIRHAATRLAQGSVCVVGTNGKTTVTNLLADVLEGCGYQVCCNRTGANLDSGVASAMLSMKQADLGVFECDELWLAKIAPKLQPRFIVLLNLFRDQLDRCGEIDYVQERIAYALNHSPNSVLVYNADDPLCQAVANMVDNPRYAFGIEQDMCVVQNTVADGQMCQRCSTILEYDYRQYGQLGAYRCPQCGFQRGELQASIRSIIMGARLLEFDLCTGDQDGRVHFHAPFAGHYMIYNIGAVATMALLLGCPHEQIQAAVDAYAPNNGRMQELSINGRSIVLNLAKNPTGFNQSIKLLNRNAGPQGIAFFVNDKEADGHDVSWLWDIDFEELASMDDLLVFAGGIRAHDVQVRLKYAGVRAQVVSSVEQIMNACDKRPGLDKLLVIANYTSLPSVKAELERMQARDVGQETNSEARDVVAPHDEARDATVPHGEARDVTVTHDEDQVEELRVVPVESRPVVIAHMLPDLLNLYGDGGNVKVLEQRLKWRGIPVEIRRITHGQAVDFSQIDLVIMGGSPDKEQRLASGDLFAIRDDLRNYVEDNGPLLAICGSYQILGNTWLVDGEEVPGLGIVDMTTGRANGSHDRLIDNIVLDSPLVEQPVIGYENHAGRTYLGAGVQSFGRVISSVGHGNNDTDAADGVRYKNLIGTYLHGPLLSKNPELADHLLARALERRARRTGAVAPDLVPLQDAEEHAAHAALIKRFR